MATKLTAFSSYPVWNVRSQHFWLPSLLPQAQLSCCFKSQELVFLAAKLIVCSSYLVAFKPRRQHINNELCLWGYRFHFLKSYHNQHCVVFPHCVEGGHDATNALGYISSSVLLFSGCGQVDTLGLPKMQQSALILSSSLKIQQKFDRNSYNSDQTFSLVITYTGSIISHHTCTEAYY